MFGLRLRLIVWLLGGFLLLIIVVIVWCSVIVCVFVCVFAFGVGCVEFGFDCRAVWLLLIVLYKLVDCFRCRFVLLWFVYIVFWLFELYVCVLCWFICVLTFGLLG